MESMTSTFSQENYQIVCNKQNMPLKLDKVNNNYLLDLEIKNNNYDLNKLMDFQIYNLIQTVNPDIIENIEIVSQPSPDEIEVLFLFKRFGKSAGIPQKYLFLKTTRQKNNNFILFSSSDSINIPPNMSNHVAQKMDCKFFQLTVLPFQEKIRLNFIFNIDVKEDLPIYMENMIGLMMKKIFYNLKLVLEKE